MQNISLRSRFSLLRALLLLAFALTAGFAVAGETPRKTESGTTAAAAKNDDSNQTAGSQDNLKAMQTKITEQQDQIDKLSRAVELLTRRLNDTAPDATANTSGDAQKQASSQSAAVPQVTSLTPVIPSSVRSNSASMSLPAGPGQQKKEVGVEAGQAKTSTTPELVLSDLAYGKIKIGATVYASFSHFTGAGFSPAFQDTPTTQLAPTGTPASNNGLNTFEVNRAYINLLYAPDEHVTLRITPDIYRQSDGSYSFRLKYAYFDLQNVFGKGAFKKTKLTFGQTQNPLIDWEEGLSGYRFVYLVPWNYVSLSSTYGGIKLHGPIEFNGKEYLDYDFGIFNTASFHAIETNDKKQVMGRLTWYPFGTKSDRTGFGLTAFDDYGYNTKLPSQVSAPINRFSFIAHWQSKDKAYQAAFEYQLGHNAASAGNLWGATGAPSGTFAPFGTAVTTAMGGVHTRQEGFDFFGHARLGKSPFAAFGLYQRFKPNTNFDPTTISLSDNPGDFQRFVAGINYEVTKHFSIAVGDENFRWIHPQSLATGGNTNGIVGWTQFNY